jgi:hypothetical protein
MRGFLPIIPPRSTRKAPLHRDYRRCKDRNRIERMVGKLKQQRRIATRYDKTVLSFESFLNLAAARLWLKSLSTRPKQRDPLLQLTTSRRRHDLAPSNGDLA